MASKRRIRRQMCGKIRHLTQTYAVLHARKFGRKQGVKYRTYKCPFCNGWHIGHNRVKGA